MYKYFLMILIYHTGGGSAYAQLEQREVFVDITKDFIDSPGIAKGGYFLGKKSYFYVGQEDFNIVSSPGFQHNFKKGEQSLQVLPQRENQFWVKISFFNPTAADTKIYIFSDLNITRNLAVYDTGLIKSLTHQDYLSKRIIELDIKAQSLNTFYITVFSYASQRQDFAYWNDKDSLIENIIATERNYGIIITIFSMSLIFTLIIFISYRSKVYIFYFIYLTSYGLFTTTYWGTFALPNADYIATSTASLSIIFATFFSINFLNLKGWFKTILFIFIGIASLNYLSAFFDLSLANKFAKYVICLNSFIIIVSSIYTYIKKREQHVALFMIAWGTFLTGIIVQVFMFEGFIPFISSKIMFYSAALENILMTLALAGKIYNTEKDRIKNYSEIKHSYAQLKKMFYPHQLTSMQKGAELEMTMPVGSSQACVISFDIAGSSKINAGGVKDFFRDIFSSCNNMMIKDYKEDIDINRVVSNGFRIKEMGDGLICSVGFPYKSVNNNPFMDAVELAEDFIQIFNEKVATFRYPDDIFCGCGIAYGPIETFYPASSPVEYDAYGRGIVLACRYEAMRKPVLDILGLKANILIISETVYNTLDKRKRETFEYFDFKENNRWVRDDPDATCLFYRIMY